MVDTFALVTTVIVPFAGTLLANIMYFSPVKAVRQVQAQGLLGDLNPLPYPMAVVNCTSWLLYSLAVLDIYVFAANILGMLTSLYFTMVTFPMSSLHTQTKMSWILLIGLGALYTAAAVAWMCFNGNKYIMGVSANVALFIYYSGPLTTLSQVIKRRDSKYFDLTMAIASVVNTSFWMIYGFVIADYFIV
jgi:solute carrier family 50 protein (sugar transporter)